MYTHSGSFHLWKSAAAAVHFVIDFAVDFTLCTSAGEIWKYEDKRTYIFYPPNGPSSLALINRIVSHLHWSILPYLPGWYFLHWIFLIGIHLLRRSVCGSLPCVYHIDYCWICVYIDYPNTAEDLAVSLPIYCLLSGCDGSQPCKVSTIPCGYSVTSTLSPYVYPSLFTSSSKTCQRRCIMA